MALLADIPTGWEPRAEQQPTGLIACGTSRFIIKKHPYTKVYGCFLVRPGGFEPLAFRVGAERSIQLSYDRTIVLIHQYNIV